MPRKVPTVVNTPDSIPTYQNVMRAFEERKGAAGTWSVIVGGSIVIDGNPGQIYQLESRSHPFRRHKYLYRATNRPNTEVVFTLHSGGREITTENGLGAYELQAGDKVWLPQLNARGTVFVQ